MNSRVGRRLWSDGQGETAPLSDAAVLAAWAPYEMRFGTLTFRGFSSAAVVPPAAVRVAMVWQSVVQLGAESWISRGSRRPSRPPRRVGTPCRSIDLDGVPGSEVHRSGTRWLSKHEGIATGRWTEGALSVDQLQTVGGRARRAVADRIDEALWGSADPARMMRDAMLTNAPHDSRFEKATRRLEGAKILATVPRLVVEVPFVDRPTLEAVAADLSFATSPLVVATAAVL